MVQSRIRRLRVGRIIWLEDLADSSFENPWSSEPGGIWSSLRYVLTHWWVWEKHWPRGVQRDRRGWPPSQSLFPWSSHLWMQLQQKTGLTKSEENGASRVETDSIRAGGEDWRAGGVLHSPGCVDMIMQSSSSSSSVSAWKPSGSIVPLWETNRMRHQNKYRHESCFEGKSSSIAWASTQQDKI